VQIDDTEVINFLLSTEIIPLCLKTMEMGSELSKTVATFIVQKILIDQVSVAPIPVFCTVGLFSSVGACRLLHPCHLRQVECMLLGL